MLKMKCTPRGSASELLMLCLLSVSARPSGPQRKTPILELLRKRKYGQKLGMEQLDILHVNNFLCPIDARFFPITGTEVELDISPLNLITP